jgi:hypothetical protein
MPAISNIVISDGEATPVAHTFEPARTAADIAFYEDRDAGIYIGNKKITVQMDRPQGNGNVGNRNLKLRVKLEMPRLETLSNSTASGITPAPTVAYRLVAEILFTLPERSTAQERKNLRTLLRNLTGDPQVVDAVEKLAVAY